MGLRFCARQGPRGQSEPAPRSKPRVGCRRLIPAAMRELTFFGVFDDLAVPDLIDLALQAQQLRRAGQAA
jgi:hypothetical protein